MIFFLEVSKSINIFRDTRSHLWVLEANFSTLGVRNCYETKILDECELVIKRESAWEIHEHIMTAGKFYQFVWTVYYIKQNVAYKSAQQCHDG